MNDWIAIFKTGTHTASDGSARTWTEDDLDRIVSSYDPLTHEAPVVIGHPKDNAPAYGWAEALKRDGEMLFAKLKDLAPEFVDWLKNKLYKKRSISLYSDGTLRHIGFLGGKPPAVKGLPDIVFSDADAAITWEFNEIKKEVIPMFWTEWFKKKAKDEGVELEGLPVPPPSFSEADINKRVEGAVKAEREKLTAEFTESQKTKEDDLKRREVALAAKEREASKAGIKAFCEGLLKNGKITPATMKLGMGLENFLEQIADMETTVEFGEDDEKKKQTPLEFMQDLLQSAGKQIDFTEVATKEKEAPRMGSGKAGEKIEQLITDKMKADDKLTYGMAFAEIQREHVELAEEYFSEVRKEG